MTKRPCLTSVHRRSIRPSTRFKRLPMWVSKADIVAYLKFSRPTPKLFSIVLRVDA
ncbi:MAG TPA: hypothetical protein VN666_15795 [Nitrospira sp.]|nr:hypothetical protein [Nitrospira sp.]